MCMYVVREGEEGNSVRFAPACAPFGGGGVAGEADRLSQKETGCTAVMDRLGSGAGDRVAECE